MTEHVLNNQTSGQFDIVIFSDADGSVLFFALKLLFDVLTKSRLSGVECIVFYARIE